MKSTTVKQRVLDPVKSVVSFARGHIHETIRIRDKHQFELRLHYPLEFESEVSKLDLECYIFLPNSLGVHRLNFTKSKFYDDLYTEIRLKTPSYSLNQISQSTNGPIQKLAESINVFKSNLEKSDYTEYQLKLFCCILQSTLKSNIEKINLYNKIDNLETYIQSFLDEAQSIIQKFRPLKEQLNSVNQGHQTIQVFKFADEYIGLLFEQTAFAALERLDNWPSQATDETSKHLIRFIQEELDHRKRNKYPTVPSGEDSYEMYIYRRSKLKLYMHSVLTLETRKKREGNIVEHLMFAIAGGISMLFATSALFISQSFYGSLTIPVFIVLVISYMFKDRIKEILRVYFSKVKSNYLYDHKTKIYRNHKTLIGLCRESFDYLSTKKIPPEILDIRHSNYQTEVESTWLNEATIRYRKQIKLYSEKIQSVHKDLDLSDINDILRFDFSEFARRMGVPNESLHIVTDNSSVKKINAQRVYHINMVLKYAAEGHQAIYKRLRIVLNRRNIKRVELVDH